jgi:proton-dependent oligopeptide transporter, POT family
MTAEKTWFGHPRGLTILFLTNMWEQFSYYGMRTLLVYYMTKQLMIAADTSSVVYGYYTAFAYLTPLLGGFIADRYLGKRLAIIIGGSVMALGHFMMTQESLFYAALATIAIGNGLFLPSLPSQIKDLYAPGDPRAPRAYNVYYVGVNIGAVLAIFGCGALGELYGWHWGFGAAGVGMVIGLTIYLSGQRHLPEEKQRPRIVQAAAPGAGMTRDTLLLLLGLGAAVVLFRSVYEQMGNSVMLFADTGVDRIAGQFTIPATWFIMINPACVMLMTPLLLAWWRRREAAGHDPTPARRMATGALIVGASYLLLAALSSNAGNASVHWMSFALFWVVMTLGELFILPTGLGLFARLAPPRIGATTVASWFLVTGVGNWCAGQVGTLWTRMSHPAFFALLGAICAIAALGLRLMDAQARRASPEIRS